MTIDIKRMNDERAILAEIFRFSSPVWGDRGRETPTEKQNRFDQRSVLYVELARRLVTNGLDAYKPREIFARPGHLPDESELAWHLRTAAMPRAPKSSKEIAADWYGYRDHVLHEETIDEGAIVLLLRSIAQCEAAPQGIGIQYADRMREFIANNYERARLPEHLPPEGDTEWRALVRSLVRRTDVIPSWLVHFPAHGRPPRGVSLSAPTSVTADQPEPESKDEQSEIAF